jgi:hypothetical protein
MNNLTTTDLGQMLINVSSLFSLLELLIRTVVGVIGFILFVNAIRKAIKLSATGLNGDPQNTPGRIFGYVILSVILFRYSIFMPDVWNSLFGSGGHQGIYTYTNFSAPGPYADVIKAALQFVQLMGWYFGAKGLMDFKHATDGQAQPGLVSKGFTHLFGGLACIHIGSFLSMVMAKLLGG